MPRVSVIVPCYNVAQYLPVSLGALKNQTLTDIEIICVNDASTDNTLDVLKLYAQTDDRITVISAPHNGGVAMTRNMGLDVATGEYIGFVDPDDCVDTDFYEKLYNAATRNGADIAKASVVTIDTDGGRSYTDLNDAVLQDKLNFQYEFSSAIYRKEFLDKNDLRFMVGCTIGEDVNFLIKAAYHANRISVINTTAYMYIRRENSAYSDFLGRNKIENVCMAATDLFKWQNTHAHMSYSDYMNILRAVYSLLIHNLPRAKSHSDKAIICESAINIYHDAQHKPDVLKRMFHKCERTAVIRKDIAGLIKTLSYQHRRYKLFGFIPLAKVMRAPGQEYKIVLFDFIPIFTGSYGKLKDNFFVCGIKILTITH